MAPEIVLFAAVGDVTIRLGPNSEVLPKESVAVAVTNIPVGMAPVGKENSSEQSSSDTVTVVESIKVRPSPFPEGSADVFVKNSIVNVSSTVESSVNWIVVESPLVKA